MHWLIDTSPGILLDSAHVYLGKTQWLSVLRKLFATFHGGNKQCLLKCFPYLQGNLSRVLFWASRSVAIKREGSGGGCQAMTLVVKPHPRRQAPVQDIPSVVQGRPPKTQQT